MRRTSLLWLPHNSNPEFLRCLGEGNSVHSTARTAEGTKHSVLKPPPPSGRPRARFSRLLPALALLLGAVGLFAAGPVAAQTKTFSIDDDNAGVAFTGVNSGGHLYQITLHLNTPRIYRVVLTSRPVEDVTIKASGGPGLTVSPASHTFAASSANDWREPKEFTVTGNRIGTTQISHTVISADPKYASLADSDWDPGRTWLVNVKGSPTRLTLRADPMPAEGGGVVTVTATLDHPASMDGTTVRLTPSGTATGEGTDYTLSSTTISIAGAQTIGTATIRVTDDSTDDDGETIVLDAASTDPPLTAQRLTLTIEDNDDAPSANPYATLIAKMYEWRNDPQWSWHEPHTDRWDQALLAFGETVSDTSLTAMTAAEAQTYADRGWTRWVEVAETLQQIESSATQPPDPVITVAAGNPVTEGTPAGFTLTAAPAPATDLAVTVAIAQSGDVADASALGTRTVTIPVATASAAFTVATVDDGADESDGAIVATLAAGTGYTVSSSQGAATVAVTDDDDAPSANPYATLIAKMYEWRNDPQWSWHEPHTDRWDQALLAFGETVSDTSLTAMTAAEAQAFADRGWTRWVEVAEALRELEAANAPPPASEPDPVVTVAAGNAVTEGTPASFTLTVAPAPATGLEVPVTISQSGDVTDSWSLGARTVRISAGQTSMTIVVVTMNDVVDEPDGAIVATLSASSGYTVGAAARARVAVADDDDTPGIVTKRSTAREGTDDAVVFTVRLSRAAPGTVTVDWATADGAGAWYGVAPATAGADYTASSGTVTFAAGERFKSVRVPILDDAIDESLEHFLLRLSNPQGAHLEAKYRETIGFIRNSDPVQQAWLSRFGRTAATHVTDAVSERLRGGGVQGSHLTVGGYRLPVGKQAAGPGGADDGTRGAALLQGLAVMLGVGLPQAGGTGLVPEGAAGPDSRLGQSQSLNVDLRRMLLGSAFRLNLNGAAAGAATPRLTAWGRFAGTTFDGQDGNLSLDGDVFTGTVGLDGEWDRLVLGVAVAHSRGDGGYVMRPNMGPARRGDVENTLTSLHPYLRYAVTKRLDVWGLAGYGWGDMDLAQATGGTYETDAQLLMGAFGGRGILLPAADTGGVQLATRTDAMLTRTTSDAVTGTAGNLAAGEGEAHRVRVILEGSRAVTWADGRHLTPTLELGVRHDWGDAETGFGLEVGGRVQYADPTLGLTVEGAVRGLLAHEDDAYQEWGASGNIRLAPGPAGRGVSLTLAPTWGAAASGVEGLWARQTTQGLAPVTRPAQRGQLAADMGYGVAAFDSGLVTPYAGTVLAAGAARTYRVGTRLQLPGQGATGLTVTLEGTRQEPGGPQPVNQGVQLQAAWGF